jgi:hypothetical protein
MSQPAASPLHPLGDFKEKPTEGSDADAPEKHGRDHRFFPCFLQNGYDLVLDGKQQIVKVKSGG